MKKIISVILCLLLVLPVIPVVEFGVAAANESYTVTLTGYDSAQKIAVIKLIRELTGKSLSEAKQITDNVPAVIAEGLTYSEMSDMVDRLQNAGLGITVSVKDLSGVPEGAKPVNFILTVVSYSCSKMEAITALRNATGMGLGDAKIIVESLPYTLTPGVDGSLTNANAANVHDALNAAGVYCQLTVQPRTSDAVVGLGSGWYSYKANIAQKMKTPYSVFDSLGTDLMVGEYCNGYIYGFNSAHEFVFAPVTADSVDKFIVFAEAADSQDLSLFTRTRDLAYDPVSGKMYALVTNTAGTKSELYTINMKNGRYTRVGTFGDLYSHLAIDGLGNAYALKDKNIYTVDLAKITAKYSMTITIPYGFISDIAVDRNTGEFFFSWHVKYTDINTNVSENDPHFYDIFDQICTVDFINQEMYFTCFDGHGDLFGIPVLVSLSDVRAKSTADWVVKDGNVTVFGMNADGADLTLPLNTGDFTLLGGTYYDGYLYGTAMDASGNALVIRTYLNLEGTVGGRIDILCSLPEYTIPGNLAYNYSNNAFYMIDGNNNVWELVATPSEGAGTYEMVRLGAIKAPPIDALAIDYNGRAIAVSNVNGIALYAVDLSACTAELLCTLDIPHGFMSTLAFDMATGELFGATRFWRYELYEEESYVTYDRVFRLNPETGHADFIRPISSDNFPASFLAMIPDFYPVIVEGVRVTNANKGDVLGDGTVRYNPDTNTLILDGAHLSGVYSHKYTYRAYPKPMSTYAEAAIVFENALTGAGIFVCGACSIDSGVLPAESDTDVIFAASFIQITMESEAILDIHAESSSDTSGITANGVTVDGGTLNVTTERSSFETYGIVTPVGYNQADAVVNISAGFGEHYSAGILTSGPVVVNEGMLSVFSNGADYSSYGIETEYGDVVLLSTQGGSIYAHGSDAALSTKPSSTPTCTVLVTDDLIPWNEKTDLSTYKTVEFLSDGGFQIFVGGIQVTYQNMHDILGDGTVSFDREAVALILVNAHINTASSGYYGSSIGIENAGEQLLSIVLHGQNTLTVPANKKDVSLIGISSNTQLYIVGPGSLDISMPEATGTGECIGVFAHDITIFGATLNVVAGQSECCESVGLLAYEGVVEVLNGAKVYASGSYVGGPSEMYNGASIGVYARYGYVMVNESVLEAWGAPTASGESYGIYVENPGMGVYYPVSFFSGSITAVGSTANSNQSIHSYADVVDARVNNVPQASGRFLHDGVESTLKTYKYVSISTILWGDVNGDGVVKANDLALLRKYFAGLDFNTGISDVSVALGADANGDGVINTKDLALLRKYLANLDYDSGESTVVLGPEY